MVGHSDEARITGGLRNGRAPQGENDALVERLEIPEIRAVIQHQDGHDLAASQSCLWSTLLGRLCSLAQQPSFPMRAKGLAKVVELTEVLYEPVEHGRLPTSDGANSKRGTQALQELSLTSNP